MFRLVSKIEIEKKDGQKFDFDFLTECEISGSWANFTDTAKLTFPKNVKFGNYSIGAGENTVFNRGDKINIWLGYDDNLKLEFSGYISKVKPSAPITIEAENESFLLKQKTIPKLSFKKVDLKELLTAVIPEGITVESPSAELGAFRVTNATAMQVLEELKKTYGFPAFFRNGTLFVGNTYVESLREKHVVKFERDVVSSDLEYKQKKDTKIKIEAISMLPDNTKLKIETGDPEGEKRTLTYYNITSEKELKAKADAELERLKYDGYFGAFTMFGTAQTLHQHVVQLIDKKFPERDGEYFIKSHNITFGQSGFRRKNELGLKSLV